MGYIGWVEYKYEVLDGSVSLASSKETTFSAQCHILQVNFLSNHSRLAANDFFIQPKAPSSSVSTRTMSSCWLSTIKLDCSR